MRTLSLLLLLSACSPKPALAPQALTAKRDGVTLTADPAAWNAKPHNLSGFAIALAVTVTNHGSEPISVRADDFTLLAGHRRHEALADGQLIHVQKMLARLSPRAAGEPLTIVTREPPPIVGADAPSFAQAMLTERTSEITDREEWKQSDRFLVYRGPQIYFAGEVSYVGTPDSFFLVAHPAPPNDLAAVALMDGVLAPGESRSGFIYFARPEGSPRHFTLSWRPLPMGAAEDDSVPEAMELSFLRG